MIQKQQTEARQRKDRVVLTFKSCQRFFMLEIERKKEKERRRGREGERRDFRRVRERMEK